VSPSTTESAIAAHGTKTSNPTMNAKNKRIGYPL
jgi:hypothetical protein